MGDAGQGVDEVEADEAVRHVVMHPHAEQHAPMLEMGHLEDEEGEGRDFL